MTTSNSLSWPGRGVACALVIALTLVASHSAPNAQSLSYTKGQNVSPAYEGWEQAPDGTRYFLFGYMNRNWAEELDVPVGAANTLEPGGPDQGQPTHFLPRRNRFVFRVPVPKHFTEKDEMVWSLTTHGKTEKAYATLRPDYLVDDVVKASETGALGAGTSSPEVRSNRPPVVRVDGPKTLKATVGTPLPLTAWVVDDGIPKPRRSQQAAAAAQVAAAAQPARRNPALVPPTRVTVGKVTGLHLSWFVYRGAGKVTFAPEQIKPWEDTRAGANSPWAPLWRPPTMPADGAVAVSITFDEPGTYVLRGLADDGALLGGADLTVIVTK